MTAEQTNYQPEQALDDKWYDLIQKLGAFQAHEYLDGDKQWREEQKRRFFNGEIENPTLDYPKIKREQLQAIEQGLLKLKRDILAEEPVEIVKQAYRWKINEKLAEARMLLATLDGNNRRFQAYTEFIYGQPSPEVFSYTVNGLQNLIDSLLNSDNPVIAQAASDLKTSLPNPSEINRDFPLPTKEDVVAVRQNIPSELDPLLNMESNDEKKKYDAQTIKEIFQQALDNLKIQGWQILIIETSSKTVNVNQETKTINIPSHFSATLEKLKKLIAHEIATHIDRRNKGERSRLQLLGIGLDRYEKGDEGIATMRAQSLDEPLNEFAGLEGHLAIGLALGLIDQVPKNFRQVYEILKKYFYLKELLAKKTPEEALKTAQESAFNRAIRTFRGTNCSEAGICYTKDIVYREGNIGVWEIVHQNPDELIRFNIGRYDPTNERHLYVLEQIGINDQDLQALAEK